MKHLLLTLVLCLSLSAISCDKDDISDKATVWFEIEAYDLPAQGGEVIIPVYSTGVDYVAIKHTFEDAWDFNSQGNMVPRPSWISVEVIPNYPASRELMTGRSGIKLTVEANTAIANRQARLIVGSYGDIESILLRQPSVNIPQQ